VSGSGISWAICKSAPRSRQITTPAPHHSVFYRPDALPAAQQTTSMHWRPKESPYRNRCRNSKVGLPNQYRILPKHNVNTPTLLSFWCMHVILLKMYMSDTSRNKPNFLLNWELLFTTKHKGGRRKSPRRELSRRNVCFPFLVTQDSAQNGKKMVEIGKSFPLHEPMFTPHS